MTGDLAKPLNGEDIEFLETWLMSDDSPPKCMDLSMLHGFLAAIISGPLVMPSEWLDTVWGTKKGPAFLSIDEAREIYGLIMRLQNEIALTLFQRLDDFDPMLYENHLVDPPVEIADEWCDGYMRGVKLRSKDWAWLTKSAEHNVLFAPMRAMAFFNGVFAKEYERVHDDPALFEVVKAQIAPSVRSIYRLWRAREWATAKDSSRA